MSDLTRLTAVETAAAISSGETSAVEVTRAHLDRIGAVDGELHAFLYAHADSQSNANPHAKTYAYAHPDVHAHPSANPHAKADAYIHPDDSAPSDTHAAPHHRSQGNFYAAPRGAG